MNFELLIKYLFGDISYIELVNNSKESKFLIVKELKLNLVIIISEKTRVIKIIKIINIFENENFSLDAILVMYINKISIPPTITRNRR